MRAYTLANPSFDLLDCTRLPSNFCPDNPLLATQVCVIHFLLLYLPLLTVFLQLFFPFLSFHIIIVCFNVCVFADVFGVGRRGEVCHLLPQGCCLDVTWLINCRRGHVPCRRVCVNLTPPPPPHLLPSAVL